MNDDERVLHAIYERFNARDVDGVLAHLAPDVLWANGMDGGHVRGRDAVRAYWTRQWLQIDPHVAPEDVAPEGEGAYVATVRQVVRDRAGALLVDERVEHVFRFERGLIARFDVRGGAGLRAIGA